MAHEDAMAVDGPSASTAMASTAMHDHSEGTSTGPFRLAHTLTGHKRAVTSVKFSPTEDHLLASSSADGTIRVWDTNAGVEAGPSASAPMGHEQGINEVAWNPHGNYIASVSDDQTARIWDVEKGACLLTLSGHTNYAFCCKFDPVGHILATGSFDETIRWWDVRSGRCLRETPAHSDPVTAIDFNPDGTILASASFDGLLRLWDTANGHCLKTLALDKDTTPVNFVCFSPNGRYLLQGTLDSQARLVNYERGRCAKLYKGHKCTTYCCTMAFVDTTPRPFILAGSEDHSAVLWDVNSKQVVQVLPGHLNPEMPGDGHCGAVLCCASHSKRQLLATGGHTEDATIKLWAGSC